MTLTSVMFDAGRRYLGAVGNAIQLTTQQVMDAGSRTLDLVLARPQPPEPAAYLRSKELYSPQIQLTAHEKERDGYGLFTQGARAGLVAKLKVEEPSDIGGYARVFRPNGSIIYVRDTQERTAQGFMEASVTSRHDYLAKAKESLDAGKAEIAQIRGQISVKVKITEASTYIAQMAVAEARINAILDDSNKRTLRYDRLGETRVEKVYLHENRLYREKEVRELLGETREKKALLEGYIEGSKRIQEARAKLNAPSLDSLLEAQDLLASISQPESNGARYLPSQVRTLQQEYDNKAPNIVKSLAMGGKRLVSDISRSLTPARDLENLVSGSESRTFVVDGKDNIYLIAKGTPTTLVPLRDALSYIAEQRETDKGVTIPPLALRLTEEQIRVRRALGEKEYKDALDA
ncbi:MAG: hypothetical protein Q7S65_01400, partial [Nanoarchaeota archaeon]|nr:hypothetical protein [Nanoarchaeota archaeon]